MDWAPLMPQLYTRIMWAFHLPVGSATASPPISAPLPVSSEHTGPRAAHRCSFAPGDQALHCMRHSPTSTALGNGLELLVGLAEQCQPAQAARGPTLRWHPSLA